MLRLNALSSALLAVAVACGGCREVHTVTDVIDGETLRLSGVAEPVRLLGAHAPKLSQPRGVDAGVMLCSLVCGQQVRVQTVGKARDVRIVRVAVLRDGAELDVAAELVRAGLAWSRGSRYSLDMHEAQQQQRGVWVDADATAPWLWTDSPSSLPRRRSE